MNSKNIYLILPTYNEAKVLDNLLKEILQHDYNVIVVDDGSTDNTPAILDKYPVTIIRHAVNLGQGAALQTGMDWARTTNAEIVVHFDSDGQHRVADIERLIEPIFEGECDLALGSRFINPEDRKAIPPVKRILLQFATFIEWLFTGIKLTDAHNGIRALNKYALSKIEIKENRMAHATELIMQGKANDLRIKEIPVQVIYTDYSRQKGQSLLNGLNVVFSLILKKFSK